MRVRASDDAATALACQHLNDFWGLVTADGELVEHFGRKCRGASEDPDTGVVTPCGFRFRFKNCPQCGEENDIAAKACLGCGKVLVDNDKKLREGERACPFNSLYWDFFTRNKDKLAANARLGMVYRQLDRMGDSAVRALQAHASELRRQLERL